MSTLNVTNLILSLALGLMTFLFIFRIILTWYPQAELNRFPFNIIALPTEPFLVILRKTSTSHRWCGHYADYLGGNIQFGAGDSLRSARTADHAGSHQLK